MNYDNYLDMLYQGMGDLVLKAELLRARTYPPKTIQFGERQIIRLSENVHPESGQEAIAIFKQDNHQNRSLQIRRELDGVSRVYETSPYPSISRLPRKTVSIHRGQDSQAYELSELAKHMDETSDSTELDLLEETVQILQTFLDSPSNPRIQ